MGRFHQIILSILLLLCSDSLYAESSQTRVIRDGDGRSRASQSGSTSRVKVVGRVKKGGAVGRRREARKPKVLSPFLELLPGVENLPLPPLVTEQPAVKTPVIVIQNNNSDFSTAIETRESSPPSNTVSGTPRNQSPSNTGSKIGFNDSAPEGRDSVDIPTNKNNRSGPDASGGGSEGSAQALPKWFAVCILIDPDIPDGNEIVKGVVEHAASCGVVMEAFPFTIRQNYPNNPGAINAMAKKACNLTDVLGVENAAVSTVVRFSDTAGVMCGETENPESVAGCSEVGGGPKGGGGQSAQQRQEQLQRMQASGHSGGEASGGIAANIVARQGADADTTMHEFGHGILAEENGGRIGLGLGRGGGGGGGNGFNAEGCSVFRASAFDNDGTHFFDPNRETYFVKTENPRFQRDLTENRSFFGGPPGLPPIKPKPPVRPPEQELPDPKPEKTLPPVRVASVAPPAKTGFSQTSIKANTSEADLFFEPVQNSKHKKKPKGGDSLSSDEEFFGEGATASASSGGGLTKSIGFNDEADEEDGETLSGDFFKGSKEGSEATDRLLGSLEKESEEKRSATFEGSRNIASTKSPESQSSTESTGQSTGFSPGVENQEENKGFFFDFNGEELLDYVTEKTKDILDSEFFSGIFSGKPKPAQTANDRQRKIRVVKDIY